MSTKPTSARKLAANKPTAESCDIPPSAPTADRRQPSADKLKHGLRAADVVLPNDPAESPEEFDALRDELFSTIEPNNIVESLLVERLTVAHWRLRRLYRHEAHCTYDHRVRNETDPARNLTRELGFGHGADLPAQLPPRFPFDQLLKYEAALNRTINQILKFLIQLRASPSPLFAPNE